MIKLGIDANAVRKEFKKGGRSAPLSEDRDEPAQQTRAPLPKPPKLEWWLLRLLLEADEYADWTARYLDLTWVTHLTVREVIRARLEAHANGTWPGVATWMTTTGNADWQTLVAEALSDPNPVPNPEETLKGSALRAGTVQHLRDRFVEQQIAALQQRVLRPDLSDQERLNAMAQMPQLRKLLRQPLTPLGEQ